MRENFERTEIKYKVQHLGETRDQVISEISVELGLVGQDWDFMWYVGNVLYEKQEMLAMYEEACFQKIVQNPDLFFNSNDTGLLQVARGIIETLDDIEVGTDWNKLDEPGRTNNITVVAWRRALQRYFTSDEELAVYDTSIYNQNGEMVNIRNHSVWHEVLDGAFLDCPATSERADLNDIPIKNKPTTKRWYEQNGHLKMEEAWQQRVVVTLSD